MKTQAIIKEYLENDSIASSALARNMLNMSAYARQLIALHEQKTAQLLPLQTVVTALNRLKQAVLRAPEAYFVIDTISTEYGIMAFRLKERVEAVDWLKKKSNELSKYYLEIHGESLQILCAGELIYPLWQEFGIPEGMIDSQDDLAVMTININKRYLKNPTVLKTLYSAIERTEVQLDLTASVSNQLIIAFEGEQLTEVVTALSKYLDPLTQQ